MSALAGFGSLVVVEGLVTPGDAAKTADDIMASEGVFRFGVASLYLVVVGTELASASYSPRVEEQRRSQALWSVRI